MNFPPFHQAGNGSKKGKLIYQNSRSSVAQYLNDFPFKGTQWSRYR